MFHDSGNGRKTPPRKRDWSWVVEKPKERLPEILKPGFEIFDRSKGPLSPILLLGEAAIKGRLNAEKVSGFTAQAAKRNERGPAGR